MHPHLARDMAQDDVTILQLHPERRIGQRFQDLALHLNRFFFRHSFTSREAAHSISRLPSREKRKDIAVIVHRVGKPPLKFAFLSRLSYCCDIM